MGRYAGKRTRALAARAVATKPRRNACARCGFRPREERVNAARDGEGPMRFFFAADLCAECALLGHTGDCFAPRGHKKTS